MICSHDNVLDKNVILYVQVTDMNLEASRVDNETVIVKWDSEESDLFDIYIDDVIMRRNTKSTRHSINMGYQSRIKVKNTRNEKSESLVIEGDRRVVYEKLRGGIIDISSMDDSVSRGFKEFITENGESGDLLRVNVEVSKKDFNTEARLIKSGDTIQSSTSDKNIYLPFGFREEDQWVKIQSGDKSETLTYDTENESLVVGDTRYGFGESFVLGGRRVVLAKGSVVIVLEDSLPLVFPEEGTQQEITLDAGTVAVGVTMAKNFIQVRDKEVSGETSVSSHVLMFDPATDERLVATEINKTVDESLTLGKCTWKASGSTKTLVDTLDYDPSEVKIHSVSGTTLNSSNINTTGISFSSDDSSIFFGASSQAKLSYSDDKILVQFMNTETGEYITKAQFER